MKHVPQSFSEGILQKMVRVAYHAFNFVTGYNAVDPPTSAIGYRLIILESVAGVPGMLGGMFRHFRSLRQLQRDHGFIFTLLKEAENERMCAHPARTRGREAQTHGADRQPGRGTRRAVRKRSRC